LQRIGAVETNGRTIVEPSKSTREKSGRNTY